MSSPNMNNLILIGCLLTYISVFIQGLDTKSVGVDLFSFVCSKYLVGAHQAEFFRLATEICPSVKRMLKMWAFSLGFTLSFGAMFSKTWRVHVIFTNIEMNKKAIKDIQLVLIVILLTLIDLAILMSWQIVDPPFVQSKNITATHEVTKETDSDVIVYIEYCFSHHMNTFLIVVYLYKGLLLAVGCFLAWETRNVTIPALNDSKYIGMSVYIVVITCISGVPVSFLVSDKPDATYLIVSMFVLFSTTVTLCLVFGPKNKHKISTNIYNPLHKTHEDININNANRHKKFVEIRRDPNGSKRRIIKSIRKIVRTNSVGDSYKMQTINKLLIENRHYKEKLELQNKEMKKLECHIGRSSSSSTPITDEPLSSISSELRQSKPPEHSDESTSHRPYSKTAKHRRRSSSSCRSRKDTTTCSILIEYSHEGNNEFDGVGDANNEDSGRKEVDDNKHEKQRVKNGVTFDEENIRRKSSELRRDESQPIRSELDKNKFQHEKEELKEHKNVKNMKLPHSRHNKHHEHLQRGVRNEEDDAQRRQLMFVERKRHNYENYNCHNIISKNNLKDNCLVHNRKNNIPNYSDDNNNINFIQSSNVLYDNISSNEDKLYDVSGNNSITNSSSDFELVTELNSDELKSLINKTNKNYSTLVQTPSYQGLKFLAELQLKETDIISDIVSDDYESCQSHPSF
ncbi:hypothetical protein HELRODRAFT_164601 [Helobdella robusta]|uniref:G-protein coupled receptors family 3 profile domain-containing protein n=1 Tax=Helobdella robusta TaxID=6412 RepID=T1EVM5_HELRO|nr:hypothetical protein HELRODRAFT_164601 [Helobdella robusta]ESN94714.1 hypothetical protein HELRODRAFT_164601 [Helobdella robusta]